MWKTEYLFLFKYEIELAASELDFLQIVARSVHHGNNFQIMKGMFRTSHKSGQGTPKSDTRFQTCGEKVYL